MTKPHAGRRAIAVAVVAACLWAAPARADESAAEVAQSINNKMVKLFGSGGFRGLAHYGTGILVSADGYILTVATPMLDTRDLRVHLSDGRRYHAKLVVQESALDVALVKIDTKDKLELPFFDIAAEAKKPMAEPGTYILGFSNQFEIATRDEPMSVQRGIISAITQLKGRRGVHQASFHGNVYVLDAVTNNPGAAGGLLTTRKGQVLGLIGKELRNELTNTWINYAIPIQTTAKVLDKDEKERTISIVEIVEKKEKYVPPPKALNTDLADNYHGITLVANVVELTPPYIEEVAPGSPAAKAGLQPDDLIVYVNGEQAGNITELEKLFGRIRPE
ncbi:MAG TPA: trypsin-like peptidase domain-containing protein, partial [Gemmataceae bacterium]|nr:trypsin-like peptidase domain-containing protein [Gemmataceae bacterium]